MESEGLFTSVWGANQWESMHNITYNYPYNPTELDKEHYRSYFISLCNVLPCCACRKHYSFYINNGDTALTDVVLTNRGTLTKWLYNLHKTVSDRLGFTYDITYEMLCNKHNSYIAKCDLTNEQKRNAYKHLYDVHAPVVKCDILICFADYAISKGFVNFIKNIKYYSSLDRNSNEWYDRNQKCQELIKHIRVNGISPIIDNMPSPEELKLFELTSTTLSKRVLKNILKNMGCKVRKSFKLIKN